MRMATTPKPRRGRPPKLSREQILEAGLDLIDRQGIGGLTMRSLARDLHVDPMALYRHVNDKDDLLGAMCDHLLSDLDPIDIDAPWEPQVRELAVRLRERFAARPALLPALTSAPVTPAAIAIAGRGIDLLVRAGLDVPTANGAFNAVFSYVLGHAVIEASIPPPAAKEALRAAALAHLGLDDAPPHLDAAIELMNEPGDFELGLDLVLDGLRARLARRTFEDRLNSPP